MFVGTPGLAAVARELGIVPRHSIEFVSLILSNGLKEGSIIFIKITIRE